MLLAFGAVVFQALSLDIYYDEAYSYLGTGRWQKVHKIFLFRLANVHPLNSLLMAISTVAFPFQIWALRLPAMLSALAYLLIANNITRNWPARLSALALLVFFDQLLLFHALARGYGLCATLILAALRVYQLRGQLKDWPALLIILLLLAFYANFVALPFIVCFLAFVFLVELKGKLPKLSRRFWLISSSFTALGIFGFLKVSSAEKPLFGAYEAGFWEAIPQNLFWHYFDWWDASITGAGLCTLVFTILVLLHYFKGEKKQLIGLSLLASFLLIYALSVVLQKPLPTGRTLIPFWPPLAFSLGLLLNAFYPRLRSRARHSLSLAFAMAISYNALQQVPWTSIYRLSQDPLRTTYLMLSDDRAAYRPQADFYWQRFKRYRKGLRELERLPADNVWEAAGLEARIYKTAGLALLRSNEGPLCLRRAGRYFPADSALLWQNQPVYVKSLHRPLHLSTDCKRLQLRIPEIKGKETPRNIISWAARKDTPGNNRPE